MSRKLAVGVALAVTPLVFTAPAMAASTPIPLSFNHLVLETPATGKAQVVSATTKPLTATAEVDTTTGDFTIDPTTFSAPTYNFSTPVSGSLALTLASQATGNVNFATGAVTLSGDFVATLTIPSLGGSCMVNTGTLNLSTATTEPLAGVVFPAGATGVATGNGAFGAGWSSLSPGVGPACSSVDSFVDSGAGGIWVSRGISPTATTPGKLTATAAKVAGVKAGARANVKVTVTNGGVTTPKSLTVCVEAKAPLSPQRACNTIKTPAVGASKTLLFQVNTPKTIKAGSYRLTVKTSVQAAQTLTLKIAK